MSRLNRAFGILAIVLVLEALSIAQATEKVLFNIGTPMSNGGLIFDQKGDLYGLSPVKEPVMALFQLHRFAGFGLQGSIPFLVGSTVQSLGQSDLRQRRQLYGTAVIGGSVPCPQVREHVNCGLV
jgi:hypothetical protein